MSSAIKINPKLLYETPSPQLHHSTPHPDISYSRLLVVIQGIHPPPKQPQPPLPLLQPAAALAEVKLSLKELATCEAQGVAHGVWGMRSEE